MGIRWGSGAAGIGQFEVIQDLPVCFDRRSTLTRVEPIAKEAAPGILARSGRAASASRGRSAKNHKADARAMGRATRRVQSR